MKTFMIIVTLAIMYLGAQVMIQATRIDKLERLELRQAFEPHHHHGAGRGRYKTPKHQQHKGDL